MAKPLTNKQIKAQCTIAYPKRVFTPTVKYSVFEANFISGGNWNPSVRIPEATMLAYAGITARVPVVLTHAQRHQLNRGISGFIRTLRDKMGTTGLYIGKQGKEYLVYNQKDNLEVAKTRNRRSRRACERNDVLISNTPTGILSNQAQFLIDNTQLIVDLSKWC